MCREVQGFWIDSCKTHCYVVYPTVDEAKATYAALDGREWPPRCRSVMKPKYVTPEEATGMIDSRGNATLRRVDSAAADDDVVAVDASNADGDGPADVKLRGRGAATRVGTADRGAHLEHRVGDSSARMSAEGTDVRDTAGRRDLQGRAAGSREVGGDATGRAGSREVIDMSDAGEGEAARERQRRAEEWMKR